MPVDPSIALQGPGALQPQQPGLLQDPLGTVGKFTALQHGMLNNQVLGSELGARQALGPIFQQSTNPESGELDIGAVQKGMANDPRAAFKSPEVMLQLLQRQKTQVELQKDKLGVAKDHLEIMNSAIGSLAEAGDNVTYADLMKSLGRMAGQIDDPQFSKKIALQLADAPRGQSADAPNPALAKWVQQHQLQGLKMNEQMEQTYGKLHEVDDGLSKQLFRYKALTNTLTPTEIKEGTIPADKVKSANFRKKMEPSQAAEPVETTNPATGQKSVIPKGGFAEGQGLTAPGTYTQPVQTPGTAPGTPPAQAEPLPRSPTSASEEYFKTSGAKFGEYENELNTDAAASYKMMVMMKAELEALKAFESGGGMETRAHVAQILQAARKAGAPIPKEWEDKVAGGSIADAQQFKALATSQSINQMKQVVEGTGRAMRPEVDAFMKSYPNLSTDPDAILKIYSAMQDLAGNASKRQDMLQDFKKKLKTSDPEVHGLDITDYPAWENKKMRDSGMFTTEPARAQVKGTKRPIGEYFK